MLSLALLAILLVRNGDLKREISRRKYAEATAARLARRDALTGLPNRRLLQEEFDRRIYGARVGDERLGVMLLDLDRFKLVNDNYGHSAGDRLLQAVADRITHVLRPDDFLARLGGDEFAILVSSKVNEDPLFRIAQRILTAVAVPFEAQGVATDVTVSIGIAVYPTDGDTAEILLQRADQAMYQAKSSGRNTYALFDKALDRVLHQRMELEAEFRRALSANEIAPYYQPLFDLISMKPVGVEALARWNHPTRGLLAAQEFVGIAEDAGLVGDMFARLLRQVCADANTWPVPLPVAVNVSATQFRDVRLADKVIAVLDEGGLSPERLEIEITETALLVDAETTRRILTALKERGVRISLDDFGTGYASLRQLRELPFDKVKIDQSFVQRLENDEESRKIVSSVIGLGKALGLETIAEGIESREEADWVREHGCDFGQGYLFSRPLKASCVASLLTGDIKPSDG